MPQQKSIDDIFADFKKDVETKGYSLKDSNPAHELYCQGGRFKYTLPEDIVPTIIASGANQKKDESPTTYAFGKISPKLLGHISAFNSVIASVAKNLGKELYFRGPEIEEGKLVVFYCGIKHK